MNEKEKMLNGLKHNPVMDENLIADRTVCKAKCFEYNNLNPAKIKERETLIKQILGKTGENILIEQPFICDYGAHIEVGENFYSNHNMLILDSAKVTFGKNVFVGPNCGFYTPQHPLDAENRNKGFEYAFPMKVGDNVWFGGNVVVLAGVTIGNNSVIGAGSVVTKDIPDNVIAAGNPCKVIRKITDEDKHKFERDN